MQIIGNRIKVTDIAPGGDDCETLVLPAPIMERDSMPVSDFHLSDEALAKATEYRKIEVCQFLYYEGELAKSNKISEMLLGSQDKAIALTAHAMHMITAVDLGDNQSAFDDLQYLIVECNQGFACATSDPVLFRTSVLCALRTEIFLSARIFEFPEINNGIDSFPVGHKAYYGYLQALRAIRMGEPSEAAGIARAFKMVVGGQKPIPRALLHLAAASAYMITGETDAALEEYTKAWDILCALGAIAPFVELNFSLLGATRHYCGIHNSAEYKRIETMAVLYHEGWSGLRRMCKLDGALATLTPIEANITSLALLGWRNKEIASHLHISENTVKHQLSESYQRLQVKNRAGLRSLYVGSFVASKMER